MRRFFYTLLTLAAIISIYYIIRPSQPEKQKTKERLEELGPHDQQVQEDLKKIHLQLPHEPSIDQISIKKPASEVFSDSEAGKRLSSLMKLINYLDDPTSEEGEKAWEDVRRLNQIPKQTFNEINQALDKIKDQDETKKQFLIQYASGLEVDRDEKLDMLSEQLANSVVNAQFSTNLQAQMTPTIVFETFMNTAEDNDISEKLLLDLLPLSTAQTQRMLINSFSRTEPEKANKLLEEYGLRK